MPTPRRYLDLSRLPAPATISAADTAAQIPASIDFRVAFGPVNNQGTEGDCTGESLAGLMQGLRGVLGIPFKKFSPQFIYTLELKREGHAGQDVGAVPSDGLAIMQTVGCAPESVDPTIVGDLALPTQAMLDAAAAYKIASWHPVARVGNTPPGQERAGLMPVLQLLAQKVPIETAVLVHQSFEDAGAAGRGGQVPLPGPIALDPIRGGHAVVLCGYEDAPAGAAPPPGMEGGGRVIFRNSWGAAWGDGGYGYLPYAYASDFLLTPGLWAATLAKEVKPVPEPTTIPIEKGGKNTGLEAYPDLIPGKCLVPVDDVLKLYGIPATRDAKGVYLGDLPKA